MWMEWPCECMAQVFAHSPAGYRCQPGFFAMGKLAKLPSLSVADGRF